MMAKLSEVRCETCPRFSAYPSEKVGECGLWDFYVKLPFGCVHHPVAQELLKAEEQKEMRHPMDERDQLREECRAMREDVTRLVDERDAALAKLHRLSMAAGFTNASAPPEEYRLAAVATAERNMELEKKLDAALAQLAVLRKTIETIITASEGDGSTITIHLDEETIEEWEQHLAETSTAATAYEQRLRRNTLTKIAEMADHLPAETVLRIVRAELESETPNAPH